ncbi:MAG: VOC family protein [Pseudomonadota bacterium]
MTQALSSIALLVADYDEAIGYFVDVLGFNLAEDACISADKRWVRVTPPGSPQGGCSLLLAKAANGAQRSAIGNQSGGRVFLFLETDDFARDYARFQAAGVQFCETPRQESYGKVVVFEDLYGNRWDLIERASTP